MKSTGRAPAVGAFFVVASGGKWTFDGRAPQWVPVDIEHGKRMGTNFTLCGIRCESWQKFWEREFPSTRVAACPTCLDKVERMTSTTTA